MANFMIHGTAADMLRNGLPATDGIGTTATYTDGALLVDVAAFGLDSTKMRNNL